MYINQISGHVQILETKCSYIMLKTYDSTISLYNLAQLRKKKKLVYSSIFWSWIPLPSQPILASPPIRPLPPLKWKKLHPLSKFWGSFSRITFQLLGENCKILCCFICQSSVFQTKIYKNCRVCEQIIIRWRAVLTH